MSDQVAATPHTSPVVTHVEVVISNAPNQASPPGWVPHVRDFAYMG
jgi:hypothetical protein